MKKALSFAALLLAAAGSWAFYPKPAEPSGYMMVIGSGRTSGLASYTASITVVQPTGEEQAREIDTKSLTRKNVMSGFVDLHKAELAQLNQLSAQGWRVVAVTQSNSFQGALNETTYLLEKK
ncbi:hypothetical protein GCM10023185_41040 [Hymenobacter saemangeumensis]|uniref:DUF4177 domain-containing protein n=1 Tax=Hymenobacter saemangeumensis TaxID=1084522 RepID=A0ABP8IRA6_9BACT